MKNYKRDIIIKWFLEHSYEQYCIYDKDADELIKLLEEADKCPQ